MKLDKAIEALTTMKKVCKGLFPPDEQAAVSLGIEALKRVLDMRISPCTTSDEVLPGETND